MSNQHNHDDSTCGDGKIVIISDSSEAAAPICPNSLVQELPFSQNMPPGDMEVEPQPRRIVPTALPKHKNPNGFAQPSNDSTTNLILSDAQALVALFDSDPTARMAYDDAIAAGIADKAEETEAKYKAAFEKAVTTLRAEAVIIDQDTTIRKRYTNAQVIQLLSRNKQVGKVYEELAIRSLQNYKKELKGQFKGKLAEIERECREWLRHQRGDERRVNDDLPPILKEAARFNPPRPVVERDAPAHIVDVTDWFTAAQALAPDMEVSAVSEPVKKRSRPEKRKREAHEAERQAQKRRKAASSGDKGLALGVKLAQTTTQQLTQDPTKALPGKVEPNVPIELANPIISMPADLEHQEIIVLSEEDFTPRDKIEEGSGIHGKSIANENEKEGEKWADRARLTPQNQLDEESSQHQKAVYNALFPKVKLLQPDHDIATKITGAFMDLDDYELEELSQNDTALRAKVKETMVIYREWVANGGESKESTPQKKAPKPRSEEVKEQQDNARNTSSSRLKIHEMQVNITGPSQPNKTLEQAHTQTVYPHSTPLPSPKLLKPKHTDTIQPQAMPTQDLRAAVHLQVKRIYDTELLSKPITNKLMEQLGHEELQNLIRNFEAFGIKAREVRKETKREAKLARAEQSERDKQLKRDKKRNKQLRRDKQSNEQSKRGLPKGTPTGPKNMA